MTPADRSRLARLAGAAAHLGRGEHIEIGNGEHKCIASGCGAGVRVLANGRRRVLSLLLPGDSLSSVQVHQVRGYCTTVCLTPVTVVNCSDMHREVFEGGEEYALLRTACVEALAVESSYLLDHVVRLGADTADRAVAHLFLELYRRFGTLGLVHGDEMPLPVTQSFIAEMLSVTKEHMSRMLRSMQRQDIVAMKPGWVRILDMERLVQLAQLC